MFKKKTLKKEQKIVVTHDDKIVPEQSTGVASSVLNTSELVRSSDAHTDFALPASALPASASTETTLAPEYKYAGLLPRLGAALIDGGLCSMVALFFLMPIMFTSLQRDCEYLPDWLRVNQWVLMLATVSYFVMGSVIFPWLYTAFFESSRHQATIGKMIFGLKVRDNSLKSFSFWRSTQRLFLQSLFFSVPLFILVSCRPEFGGFICFILGGLLQAIVYGTLFFSRKKQTLYDLIVQRLVIATPAAEKQLPTLKKSVLNGVGVLALALMVLGLEFGAINLIDSNVPIFKDSIAFHNIWKQSELSKCETRVVADRKIERGTILTADDLRMENIEKTTSAGLSKEEQEVDEATNHSPRIVDVSELLGKRAISHHEEGNDVSFFALSSADIKAERERILAHIKNHTLDQVFKPIKLEHEWQIRQKSELNGLISNATMKDLEASHDLAGYSDLKVCYPWEVLGKSFVTGPDHQTIYKKDVTQSGIGYRVVRSLPVGHILQAEDFREVHMMAKSTPYSTISDQALLLGKKLSRDVDKDTLLKPYLIEWND